MSYHLFWRWWSIRISCTNLGPSFRGFLLELHLPWVHWSRYYYFYNFCRPFCPLSSSNHHHRLLPLCFSFWLYRPLGLRKRYLYCLSDVWFLPVISFIIGTAIQNSNGAHDVFIGLMYIVFVLYVFGHFYYFPFEQDELWFVRHNSSVWFSYCALPYWSWDEFSGSFPYINLSSKQDGWVFLKLVQHWFLQHRTLSAPHSELTNGQSVRQLFVSSQHVFLALALP